MSPPKVKTIAYVGNCQTAGLCKFTAELPSTPQVRWLCYTSEWDIWNKDVRVFGAEQLGRHLYREEECNEYLRTCDLVVYQNIQGWSDRQFFEGKIPETCQTISLPPVYLSNVAGMIEREERLQIDISVAELVARYPDKVMHLNAKGNHITTFLTLEILREICRRANLEFFTPEQVAVLSQTQYPYYT